MTGGLLMRRAVLLAMAVVALVVSGGARLARAQSGGASLDVNLILDRGAYEPGASISFTIGVRNRGPLPVDLTFPTSQRFDLSLQSESIEIDRYSRLQVYNQTIGVLHWAPGETMLFTGLWLPHNDRAPATTPIPVVNRPLDRGAYRIRAELTPAGTRPLSAPVYLLVGVPTQFGVGCTSLATPFPINVPVAVLAAAVDPPEALLTLWQRDRFSSVFTVYSPQATLPSDLRFISDHAPVTICLAAPARVLLP